MLATLATLAAVAGAAHAEQSRSRDCPREMPAQTRCYGGQDAHGAYYVTAIPPAWNGVLVVHSHGGPSLKPPSADEPVADLQRFAVMVAEGYAWIGSSYRHAGYGVRDAAEDTDTARQRFWQDFGRPRLTLLHGQSWGGNVAAKTAELYGRDTAGKPNYDGVILTSGVLTGGSLAYDFRADLRAVYQYYCRNLPAAGEPAYPLWQGLAAQNPLSSKEVAARLNSCTGVAKPAAQRTPEQARALRNILAVTRVPEATLASHLNWATATFRDLTLRQFQGANPFSNIDVQYRGSDDDAALNRDVARFAATPEGVRALAWDSDLNGKLIVPTLTMHAIDDPTVFVEAEAVFRDTVAAAGASGLLVQSFTDEHEHSKLATPQYAALLHAMLAWIGKGDGKGVKPSPETLAADCERYKAAYGEACHFVPAYVPRPLSARTYPRTKPVVVPAVVNPVAPGSQ
jgi:alpha-beta hydrolase superfamily lysophospholipase